MKFLTGLILLFLLSINSYAIDINDMLDLIKIKKESLVCKQNIIDIIRSKSIANTDWSCVDSAKISDIYEIEKNIDLNDISKDKDICNDVFEADILDLFDTLLKKRWADNDLNKKWLDAGDRYLTSYDKSFLNRNAFIYQISKIRASISSKCESIVPIREGIYNKRAIFFNDESDNSVYLNHDLNGVPFTKSSKDDFDKFISNYKEKIDKKKFDEVLNLSKHGVRLYATMIAIENDGRVWMTQTRGNKNARQDGTEFSGYKGRFYELPSGGINPKESIEKAAIREIFEETGLIVEPMRLYDAGYFKLSNTYGINIMFIGKRVGGNPWSWHGTLNYPIEKDSKEVNETVSTILTDTKTAKELMDQNRNISYRYVIYPKFFNDFK